MLLRNNPDIDFDSLEDDISARIESYQQALDQSEIPQYDPERLEKARLDMANLQHTNVAGGLNMLYSLEDRDFVFYAYRLFLERPPTEREAAICTERLRTGENKTRIACELRYCAEGADKNPGLSLAKERIAYKLIALPVIGGLFNLFSILISLPTLKTVSQAGSNHQYRLMESLQANINHKSQLVDEMKKAAQAKAEEVHALRSESSTLKTELSKLKTELSNTASANASSRTRINLLEQKQAASPEASSAPSLAPAAGDTYTDDSMYVAFEEKYRGTPENIRERLGYYLPLVEQTLNTQGMKDKQTAVDIGCGRGEWLKLLGEHGVNGVGLDTNLHNITSCRKQGLQAHHEDGIAWLARQKDNSLMCVSAFHVIEHLNFSQLNHFINHALRCLCPEGLLLLETPNPENLLVGANNFYLDPTHVRPLPHGLMEFLLSYKGFKEVAIHKLHPVASELMIPEESEVAKRCNQLFYEAQDYAVTARKPQVAN
jgi:SAM-dependent methyltransferase/regulator of replication initiation timing